MIICVLFFVFLHTPAVSAQSENEPGLIDLSSDDASTTEKAVVEPMREESTNRKNTYGASLTVSKQNRIFNLAKNVTNRMQAAINRFENILSRMESRNKKLATEGKDTTDVMFHLHTVKESLQNAQQTLEGMDEAVEAMVTSAAPQESFSSVLRKYASIKEDIIAARKSLNDALIALKETVNNSTIPADTNTSTTTDESV